MTSFLLYPGEVACRIAGLAEPDHRQILRMWVNTAVWSFVGVLIVVLLV